MSEELIFEILKDVHNQFENFKKGKLEGNLIVKYFQETSGKEPKYQAVEGTKKQFIGQTTRKKIEGKAVLRSGKDDFYIGDVSGSKKNGFGYHHFVDNIVYKGKYKNGQKVDGYVFHLETKKIIYEGGWKNDMYNGQGMLAKLNGQVYNGNFVNGASHGKGQVVWPNGDKYVGDFEEGLITGRGKFWGHQGDYYEGEFIYNLFDGNGKYVWKNGDSFEGEFMEGKITGNGKMNYKVLGCFGGGNWDGSHKKLVKYDLNDETNKELYDK